MKLQKVMYWQYIGAKSQIGVAVVPSFDVSAATIIVGEDGECLTEVPHDYMLLCGPLSYIDTEYKAV